MGKGTSAGFILLAIGIILWIAYGLYLGFEKIIEHLDIITGLISGIFFVGLVILIISIILEQRQNMKEMKEKIKKEDLKP
ncbi:MAG: hypothetical protein KKC68_01290 [Candidatus Thermoplasmatota archaeon]|nr:hypothetical protein [Candidatus Thermoplasmatota archaeon]MBU1940385.1 hypothetical protein [Candidatus Thermoplasmatota archaeon]